jgi:peptide/nickel transport system substrate-binding protein
MLVAVTLLGLSRYASGAGVSAQESGDTLRIASGLVNRTFPDPRTEYFEPLYADSEYLMRPSTSGAPEPWLAESMTQTGDTTWQVKLREGLKFQNGNVLDAGALVRWFEFDQEADPLAKATLGNATGFKKVDDLTVEIELSRPYSYVPYALANYSLAVYDSDTVASVDGKYEELAGKGIFTGPYAYQNSTGDTITYVANPNYWAGTPAYAGLTVTAVSDPQAGLLAVQNGEADMQFYPSSEEARSLQSNSDILFKTSDTAVTYTGIVLDPAKAPFDEVAVRQAFALAIDNEAISSTIMNGVNQPLNGNFPDGDPLNVAWKTYDPAKAEQLLEGAGWVKGTDGIRSKDGATLAVTLTSYDHDLEIVGTAVIDMLRAVGFDAKLNALTSWDDVKAELTNPSSPVNGTLENLQNYGYDGNPYLTVSKDYLPDNGYNLVVNDPEIADLFTNVVLTSSDKDAINAAFRKALELNAERVYYVPVVTSPTAAVVSSPFANITVDPFLGPLQYNTAAEGR